MKILYLAVADGRGHLMRSVLVKKLLGEAGIDVDIITTSEDGKKFIREFGYNSSVLQGSYLNSFDSHQNINIAQTKRNVISYMVNPKRFMKHVIKMLYSYGDYDLIINDTFNVTLLASSLLGMRVVNVYAHNIMQATVDELRSHLFVSAGFTVAHASAFANIETTIFPLERPVISGKNITINPLIQVPKVSKHKKKLAVVYLNPMFTEKKIGKSIVTSLKEYDYEIHAVGEGMSKQLKGWNARDSRLSDKIAAADIVVSAPGMGVLSQVMAYRKKYIAVYSRQPEQERNLHAIRDIANVRILDVGTSKSIWEHQMSKALRELEKIPNANVDPTKHALNVRRQWKEVFSSLIEDARK